MAQTLFEAFNGVSLDNQTVLTVQSLIDSHAASNLEFSSNDEFTVQDDNDVFQCGKCKKQFISLPEFMGHKKTHYAVKEGELEKCNGFTLKHTDDIHQPLLLNDSDILSFSTLKYEQPSLDAGAPTEDLEDRDTFLNTAPKSLEVDNNNYQIDAFENQIVLTAQMPNCIITDSQQNKEDLQFSAHDLNYLGPECLLTTVDKDTGKTVTVSVVRVMQDSFPGLAEPLEIKPLDTEKKLKCSHCKKMFVKNFDLQQHLRSHTGERPYQCVVCGRAFTQKSNVKKHMETHKVWPDQLRTLLPKESENSNEKESSAAVEENLYYCQFCSEVFSSFIKLKIHRKQHIHRKVYKCIQKNCNETFEDLDQFLEHITVHSQEAEYHCHLCNKEFTSLDQLGSHQYVHGLRPKATSKAVSCKKCKKRFNSSEALEKHLATESHRYVCPKCFKVFLCERFLRRHMPIHSATAPYVCSECGKGFKTEQYLNIHKVVHSSSKPFVCKICSMAFNRRDRLTRHQVIHDPVRRFKCPFSNHLGCEREFYRKDKLQQHILTHSSKKDLTCKRCKRNFKRICQLKQHEKACFAQDIPCKDCGHVTNDANCVKKTSNLPSKSTDIKKRKRCKTIDDANVTKDDDVPTIEIVVLPMPSASADKVEDGVFRVLMPESNALDATPSNDEAR